MWRDNSRRVRTHKNNSRETVRRLGTIIQSIFCAQSGASIGLNFWKWFGKSRYPGALPPVLENFRSAFSPDPTDCPWVSEDGLASTLGKYIHKFHSDEDLCTTVSIVLHSNSGAFSPVFVNILL